MKKPKHWSQPAERIHESGDDRARTWAGKTANSKVRSEGRHAAALERSAETQRAQEASEAKEKNPISHGRVRETA